MSGLMTCLLIMDPLRLSAISIDSLPPSTHDTQRGLARLLVARGLPRSTFDYNRLPYSTGIMKFPFHLVICPSVVYYEET